MMVETYRHSGRIGAIGIPLMLVGSCVSAIVFGTIYAYGLAWIPIIYASLLLTAGLGAGIGLVVGLSGKAGKVRNQLIIQLFGLVGGMIGLAAAWSFDAAAKFPEQFSGPMLDYQLLRAWGEFCYENGTWGLKGNVTVKGMFLAAIWIAETLVVLGLSFVVAGMITDSTPFCEQCMTWTKPQDDFVRLHPPEGDNLAIEKLCEGDFSSISDFTKASPTAGAYLRLDVAECGDCSQCNCVSVALAEVTVDKDGNNQINTTMLAKHMLLSEEAMQNLKEKIGQLQVEIAAEDEPTDETSDEDA